MSKKDTGLVQADTPTRENPKHMSTSRRCWSHSVDDGACSFTISGVDGEETVDVFMVWSESDDPYCRFTIKLKDLYLFLRRVLKEPDMLTYQRHLDEHQDPSA